MKDGAVYEEWVLIATAIYNHDETSLLAVATKVRDLAIMIR